MARRSSSDRKRRSSDATASSASPTKRHKENVCNDEDYENSLNPLHDVASPDLPMEHEEDAQQPMTMSTAVSSDGIEQDEALENRDPFSRESK